jgi:hypothetical protein
MKELRVGKIKKITYNEDDDSLILHIEITDKKFQKKILRDLTLSGNLEVIGTQLIFKDGEGNA